jgi:hypothetical protein
MLDAARRVDADHAAESLAHLADRVRCTARHEGDVARRKHRACLTHSHLELTIDDDKHLVFFVVDVHRQSASVVGFHTRSADQRIACRYLSPPLAAYFRGYKGHRFASTKEAVAMSEGFRRQVFDFAERHGIPIIRFEKGMRKDDVMHKRLRKFKAPESVVFIGIAQEKARVPRTIRKRFGEGQGTIPWIDYTTAMVNHYYFYCVDEDFGPFFIKFCSYFPQPTTAAITCADARLGRKQHQSGPRELRAAPPAPARAH